MCFDFFKLFVLALFSTTSLVVESYLAHPFHRLEFPFSLFPHPYACHMKNWCNIDNGHSKNHKIFLSFVGAENVVSFFRFTADVQAETEIANASFQTPE